MKFTRYHTESGSMYDVRADGDVTYVRRSKLGEKHAARGPERLAKRAADKLEDWAKVDAFHCFGVDHCAAIALDRTNDRDLVTSPVTRIEELSE